MSQQLASEWFHHEDRKFFELVSADDDIRDTRLRLLLPDGRSPF
jgi:hypothetical protein